MISYSEVPHCHLPLLLEGNMQILTQLHLHLFFPFPTGSSFIASPMWVLALNGASLLFSASSIQSASNLTYKSLTQSTTPVLSPNLTLSVTTGFGNTVTTSWPAPWFLQTLFIFPIVLDLSIFSAVWLLPSSKMAVPWCSS